jgi:hemerythrin-like domain-containing protein
MELFPRDHEALTLLKKDHDETNALFQAAAAAGQDDVRAAAARRAIAAFKVHCIVEEEMLYPALRVEPDGHKEAASLLCSLERLDPGDERYADKVAELAAQVRRHAAQEEAEVFPKLERSGVDLMVLGSRMFARRQELRTASALN